MSAEIFHTRACRDLAEAKGGYVCDGRFGCYWIEDGEPVKRRA